MSKITKAMLIDPVTRTFTPVEYDGDFREIYRFLKCDAFDVAYATIDGHDVDIYVDDEGLYNPTHFFIGDGFPSPLAGRGLVFGRVDDEGDATDFPEGCKLDGNITFLSMSDVQRMFA
jgi:hypothetical protein